MKRTISIFILLLWAVFANANEIDKINTIKDVEKFLKEKIDTNWSERYKEGHLTTVNARFFKIDFDKNGLTDLLVDEDGCYIIMALDEGSYQNHLIMTHEIYDLVDTLKIDNTPLLVVREITYDSVQNDTLIFKFGGFMEYNTEPVWLKFEEISLKSDGGWGGTVYEMKIDAERDMECRINREYFKRFFARIDSTSFDNMLQTIYYIKMTSLNDYPPKDTSPTDDENLTLELKFNYTKTKKIVDYGGYGTFGLMNLYRQLRELRDASDPHE